jgi:hypothetical protein
MGEDGVALSWQAGRSRPPRQVQQAIYRGRAVDRPRQLLERRRSKPTYYRKILSMMEQINRSALLFMGELITGGIACASET